MYDFTLKCSRVGTYACQTHVFTFVCTRASARLRAKPFVIAVTACTGCLLDAVGVLVNVFLHTLETCQVEPVDFHLTHFSAAIGINGTLLDYCLECLTSRRLKGPETSKGRVGWGEGGCLGVENVILKVSPVQRKTCRRAYMKECNAHATATPTPAELTLSHPPASIKSHLMCVTGGDRHQMRLYIGS